MKTKRKAVVGDAGARRMKAKRKAAAVDSVARRLQTKRKAVAVDSGARRRNLARLKRIEGQVRGIHRMVEDDRYCADVLIQISAVHEALRGVGRELMRNHLKHCATAAMKGSEASAHAMHDEILLLMYKHLR